MGEPFQFDAIVVGSGVGGALAAYPLVRAGWRVLMVERGGWVARGQESWAPTSVKELTTHYDRTSAYTVRGDRERPLGSTFCVGGQSVFFGGVALRFRERDFEAGAGERAAGAAWPFEYGELEPYYAAAERILGVAGADEGDPTGPWRSGPYPHSLPPLSPVAGRIAEATERSGFRPVRLPLAINFRPRPGRSQCIGCSTCDCYACGIGAKNDVASAVLPGLVRRGLEVQANTAVVRLIRQGRRISGVLCSDTRTGRRTMHHGRLVVLAAGALATPLLLLASGAECWNPAGAVVGRMLMRHCNAISFGVFAHALDPARAFHKQVGIHDLYFGHPRVSRPGGRLGTIQQVHAPPRGLVFGALPVGIAERGERLLDHLTGLISIAADEPQAGNRVGLGRGEDAVGLPRAVVHHRYTPRDRGARAALRAVARGVLREAGAITTVSCRIHTFSHALGTVRMGTRSDLSPLDEECRYRGTDNLFVADASAFPTPAGVNPSLTIAALALRTGYRLIGSAPPRAADAHRMDHAEVAHA